MGFHDGGYDAQAQPGSLACLFSREERFKHAALDLRWDAGARVLDGDFNDISLTRQANCQLAAIGHGVDGVGAEIDYNLLNLVAVERYR